MSRSVRQLGPLAALFLVGAAAFADPPRYRAVNLSGQWRPGDSAALDVNAGDQVVGMFPSEPDGATHAFFWDGVATDLGTLDSTVSMAYGLNDLGQVVGRTGARPFIWDALSGIQFLPTPQNRGGQAREINNKGQAVGWFNAVGSGRLRAGLWDASGKLRDLGSFGLDSSAGAINEAGWIVGTSSLLCSPPWGTSRAFLWTDDGAMQDLGLPEGFGDSFANDVNELGQVVGAAAYRECGAPFSWSFLRAALWENGKWTVLHTLPDYVGSEASGINNVGQIVGRLYDFVGFPTGAFLWQGGMMYDLATLVDDLDPNWTLISASAVSDTGVIAASAIFRYAPVTRAYVLYPVE